MGAAASMPVQRAAPFAPGLTHQQRTTRLYRHALRTARDWCIDTDLWLEYARDIQAEFRQNKHVGLRQGEVLVQRGLRRLVDYRHPEPYTPCYMPEGTKYQRNVPPPPELAEHSMPPPHAVQR